MSDHEPPVVRTLCVLIPVYNEIDRLERAVRSFDDVPPPCGLERSILLVDDGSTDGTIEVARRLAETRSDVRLIEHETNRGKGAAVRTGFKACDADVLVIHDADLEYDPRDHEVALAPIVEGRADAVIGSRFIGQTHRVLYFWHMIANKVITLLSNMLTNLNLTDIECGTKAFRREVVEHLRLKEDRFGIEPEMIAGLARMRIDGAPLRIYEVPVSYAGRTYAEGKKIGWRDGVRAILVILRCRLFG